MMMSNESIKELINPSPQFSLGHYLLSGALSGALAGGVTTPLDVCRTRLQTQSLGVGGKRAPGLQRDPSFRLLYRGFGDAFSAVWREEGWIGFTKGAWPRALMMSTSCAVFWGGIRVGQAPPLRPTRGREHMSIRGKAVPLVLIGGWHLPHEAPFALPVTAPGLSLPGPGGALSSV